MWLATKIVCASCLKKERKTFLGLPVPPRTHPLRWQAQPCCCCVEDALVGLVHHQPVDLLLLQPGLLQGGVDHSRHAAHGKFKHVLPRHGHVGKAGVPAGLSILQSGQAGRVPNDNGVLQLQVFGRVQGCAETIIKSLKQPPLHSRTAHAGRCLSGFGSALLLWPQVPKINTVACRRNSAAAARLPCQQL